MRRYIALVEAWCAYRDERSDRCLSQNVERFGVRQRWAQYDAARRRAWIGCTVRGDHMRAGEPESSTFGVQCHASQSARAAKLVAYVEPGLGGTLNGDERFQANVAHRAHVGANRPRENRTLEFQRNSVLRLQLVRGDLRSHEHLYAVGAELATTSLSCDAHPHDIFVLPPALVSFTQAPQMAAVRAIGAHTFELRRNRPNGVPERPHGY